MNTHKVNLFIHTVKYFAIRSLRGKEPADVADGKLLDKVKSHKLAVAEYNHEVKGDSGAESCILPLRATGGSFPPIL